MFRHQPERARVELAVVAYGVTERLARSLASLIDHEASTPFTITCVVNPDGPGDIVADALPAGVRVVTPEFNLGWPGGLHAAREGSEAEYLVWIQDDMEVLPGWLDALVEAADAHPDVAAFGAVGVDEHGRPNAMSAGRMDPPDDVERWNDTDRTKDELPEVVTRYDWVTSKGMLARLSAWDEIGGTDPRLFPLNHVDKDYCAHLRCHGWASALVPAARLRHVGSQSSPSPFRRFLTDWQPPRFNARWGGPLGRLRAGERAPIDHECASWHSMADVERLTGREASRMLVPASKAIGGGMQHVEGQVRALDRELTAMRSTLSWRITAPLRAIRRLRRR